jgi:hypothetical protein
MEIIKKKISEMNLAEYNPRVTLQPGDEEYETIKRSLEKYGLVQPIVWNRRTNTVVGGHQRLRVLSDMGIDEADVSVVDLDTIAEKQLNIALNKVEGKWDDKKLSEILLELGDDAIQTGFTLPEIEVLQNELQTFFDDEEDDEEPTEEEPPQDFFLLTLQFDKADEGDLKSYIKKNGEDGIVMAIVRKAKGET